MNTVCTRLFKRLPYTWETPTLTFVDKSPYMSFHSDSYNIKQGTCQSNFNVFNLN